MTHWTQTTMEVTTMGAKDVTWEEFQKMFNGSEVKWGGIVSEGLLDIEYGYLCSVCIKMGVVLGEKYISDTCPACPVKMLLGDRCEKHDTFGKIEKAFGLNDKSAFLANALVFRDELRALNTWDKFVDWQCKLRRGEQFEWKGKTYEYTGDYRPPLKGEYSDHDNFMGLPTKAECDYIYARPILKPITDEPKTTSQKIVDEIKGHELIKVEIPDSDIVDKAFKQHIVAEIDIQNEAVKKAVCGKCTHDYEPAYKGGERTAVPIEPEFKVGDVVVDSDSYVLLIKEISGREIHYLHDMSQNWMDVGNIHHATPTERTKFFNEFYTQKVGDWLVRAYDDKDGQIIFRWKKGNKKVNSYEFSEPGKTICTALGVKIMEFKDLDGEYPYPCSEEVK